MSFLLFSALCIILFLIHRLRSVSKLLAQLVESAENKRPLLLEKPGGLASWFKIDRLVQAFNQLVDENIQISQAGEGYLEQIQTTLGNLREGVIIIDQEHTIQLANRAFNKLVEAKGTPMGKRLDIFLQGSAFQEFMKEIQRSDDPIRREIEVRVNQNDLWIEASAAPLGEPDSSTGSYMLFVLHDITRQKKLEKMRTEFVANVSHELKTPVTIIKGFADTLIEDDEILEREERIRFLSKVQSNSERLHHLLQDLLLLSRLESTADILQRERLSMGVLVKDAVENWRPRIKEDTHSLELRLAKGNDVLFLDSLRMNQVLTNLLDNALKHAKNANKFTVETTLSAEGVTTSITDNGEGIQEKELPHIFERFYRVEKGRSREAGGTGLGLSIVKHIVQQHGGEISAESTIGEGTTISFLIPYPGKLAEDAVFKSLRKQSQNTAKSQPIS